MKFKKTVDITNEIPASLKRGQWVRKGNRRGRFLGFKQRVFGLFYSVSIADYKPGKPFKFFQQKLEA